MKRIYFLWNALAILSFYLLVPSSSAFANEKQQTPIVLVSIAPYKFFVDQIAQGAVDVKILVPPGASPHSYEPTVRQILSASKAKIWFMIGEAFEMRALQAIQNIDPGLETIDMRTGLSLIESKEGQRCSHHHHLHHFDPHIWLSPRLVKKQAEKIASALIRLLPDQEEKIKDRLNTFELELNRLDQEIANTLKDVQSKILLVSHPAFAYYCRDYGFTQMAIEFEGKEPTAQHLTSILNLAKKNHSRFVYVQSQHPSKGAKLIAKEIGAVVVEVDPLAENYFENMRSITRKFAAQ